jgi:hypothetical protein
MTNTSVGTSPSIRGPYFASTDAGSLRSVHHRATYGVASHLLTRGRSSRLRGRKATVVLGSIADRSYVAAFSATPRRNSRRSTPGALSVAVFDLGPDVPALEVDTTDGYHPSLEHILTFIDGRDA